MAIRRWLVRPALDKHTRPHSLQTNCARSGSILSPFLAALFVLAQIFALSWKQRDPLYTIFLHLFLSHANISQSGSSILHGASESLTQSLKRFFGLCCGQEPTDSSPYNSCLGMRSSSSRITWSTQRRRCQWMCASMLIVFAFSKTSVSGVWVIQWIPRIDLRHRWWKRSSCFRCLRYTTHVSHEYGRHVNTQALYTSILVLFFSPLCDLTHDFSGQRRLSLLFSSVKQSHRQVNRSG